MPVAGRPDGPTALVCVHGVPEHVECPRCPEPPPDTGTDGCPHGTDGTGVDCMPCRRAADVGRPPGGGPTATVLHVARFTSHCAICRRIIRAHVDRYGRHPLHEGRAVCEDCTPR